jgi:uncharacterized membrane protein (DUF373 family)
MGVNWLLVAGCQLSVVGCWLLVAGGLEMQNIPVTFAVKNHNIMELSNASKFDKGVKFVNNLVLKYLIVILTLCIVLGALHLTYTIIKDLIEPPYGLLEVSSLLDIFSLSLILVVGYELIKSLTIIISDAKIPVTPLIQIALTAVANKIITLDIKHVEAGYLYGIAALVLALTAGLFFVNYNPNGKS